MRTYGAMLAAAVLPLAVAAPASAFTGGFGIEKALRPTAAPVAIVAKTGGSSSPHRASCESDSSRGGAAKRTGVTKNVGREVTPVACEQPPRSQAVTADALKNATAAALAALG
jgi:hypothetical protein